MLVGLPSGAFERRSWICRSSIRSARSGLGGAAGIRPTVPLNRRHRRQRCGLGPFGVLKEPRTAAGRRHCDEVSERGPSAPKVKKNFCPRIHRQLADRGLALPARRLPDAGRRACRTGGGIARLPRPRRDRASDVQRRSGRAKSPSAH